MKPAASSDWEAVWTAWNGVGLASANLRNPRAFFKAVGLLERVEREDLVLRSISGDDGGDGL